MPGGLIRPSYYAGPVFAREAEPPTEGGDTADILPLLAGYHPGQQMLAGRPAGVKRA